jgi:hypothetical protein
MNEPHREISPERKTLYYVGMTVSIIGLLMFASTFVTFIANIGNFNNFDDQVKSAALRAFGGMALLIIGGAMSNIGKRGLAGSGVVLNPDKERRDVEPWSRMAGGMANDALSEVGVVKKFEEHLDSPPAATEQGIKVRCPKCHALNDEGAKFRNQCGAAM